MLDRDATTNMDELARVMDSWTLAEIAKNLDKMEERRTTSKYSPATSRFKPKAPKQRYFERHPDDHAAERAREKGSAAVMNVDAQDASTDDDEDYVLETYERVPAERLRDRAVPAHRVGLLVFDTEPDMVEFFYGNESDSEEEFPEDEEDENGERGPWVGMTRQAGVVCIIPPRRRRLTRCCCSGELLHDGIPRRGPRVGRRA